MQLQTIPHESKFPNEYIGVIFIQIDQHLKKLLKKMQRGPDFMEHGVVHERLSVCIDHEVKSSRSHGIQVHWQHGSAGQHEYECIGFSGYSKLGAMVLYHMPVSTATKDAFIFEL